MTSAVHTVPSEPVAPWAEVVPDMPPMAEDDLLALPDDGWQYELVEGVLVRMPPSSPSSVLLTVDHCMGHPLNKGCAWTQARRMRHE